MIKKAFIFSFLTLFISVSGFSATADAKRFGGGMSFGKSFSNQKSFSTPSKNLNTQSSNVKNKSGMMGILGGLAMGGLLGALFFGGAFEGINLFDILMLGAIAFGIMWFMRRAAGAQQNQYAHAGHAPYGNQADQHHDAFQAHEQMQTAAKPDIDEQHFIEAARTIFMRMQADWDNKNINDIRSFCTPEIAQHIADDLQKLGDQQNKTEVSFLDAKIADTWLESGLEWVAVHYKAMLKEETLSATGERLESENSQLNEIWVFQHNPKSKNPTWYLAGIQQA